jgi:hypothetical protein
MKMTTQPNNETIRCKLMISEQQRLLDAIWHDDYDAESTNSFNIDGINIYRRNLLANAKRALSVSFPTIFELLDSDISEKLTYDFLKLSPPTQGDWAQWGDAFASFIKTTDIDNEYPYLSGSAALDWHVHCASHGIDQTFEQSSLQLLSHCEPEHIFIEFNRNVKLLDSEFPIEAIFHAHHSIDEIQREISMKSAQQALSLESQMKTVMVYRPEFQPKVITLMPGEDVFMHSLMSGQSLAHALNVVNEISDFSFENWLIKAIKLNLLNYFKEKKI